MLEFCEVVCPLVMEETTDRSLVIKGSGKEDAETPQQGSYN